MMVFEAKIYKDGKFWLAEIPQLDALTQGKSRLGASKMLIDWIRSSLNDRKADVRVLERANGEWFVVTPNSPQMIALLLQRARIKRGLSIREVAKRLGYKSHNAYAQYETGKSEPSFSQLHRMLGAISPNSKLELKVG